MKMRNKKIISFLLLIVIFSIYLYAYCEINNNISSGLEKNHVVNEETDKNLLPINAINLPPIIIDDNGGGDYNWSEAVKQSWCSGEGTWSKPYLIQNVSIDGLDLGSCLTIRDSEVPFKIKNCTFFNSKAGLFLGEFAGLKLNNASNGLIINNTFLDNNAYGLSLFDHSNNNTIKDNKISNSGSYGIILYRECNENRIYNITTTDELDLNENCRYNDIKDDVFDEIHFYLGCNYNNISYTTAKCIYIDNHCDRNIFSNCILTGNTGMGIKISSWSNYNKILDNKISNHDYSGIYLSWFCEHNEISRNNITFNDWHGIIIEDYCEWNIISYNNISENHMRGVYLMDDCIRNQIVWNDFLNDDVYIFKSDNNAIVENYFIAGDITEYECLGTIKFGNSFDRDTFEDNDNVLDAASISKGAHFYLEGTDEDWYFLYLEAGEKINIKIKFNHYDGNLDLGLYNSSVDLVKSSESTTHNEDLSYNITDSGNYYIRIYNDDNPLYHMRIETEDILPPMIIIYLPENGGVFNNTAPKYDIEITEPNLDKSWYSIFNGTIWSKNITIETETGRINQTLWNDLDNGTFEIRFYANDTSGRLNKESVVIRKDIIGPVIINNSPKDYDLFGLKAPGIESFDIIFMDPHGINAKWYMLNNGSIYTENYTWNGYIDKFVWKIIGNGTLTIKIFANDTLGNIGFGEIILRKDIYLPKIHIFKPESNKLFGLISPSLSDFDVVFEDKYGIDSKWFKLYNDPYKSMNYSWNGYIDQIIWNDIPNGTITIKFFCNNSIGNIGTNEIYIRKETEIPQIIINSPENKTRHGRNPPKFKVYIISQRINTSWYTLGGNPTIYVFTMNGTINNTAWVDIWDSLSNGDLIEIKFYANNTAGNIGFNLIYLKRWDFPVLDDSDKKDEEKEEEEFNIIEFLISPIGLAIVGGASFTIISITIILRKHIKKKF
ncbi:MAG: hypothetical protein EU548_01460 [Promethearchaeota archaeon]|nr:MAG: hypothetical protein EU548_01460 [Candidatus Lokiarchaeota archaeon]